jgi:triphosphoribosyl-dephospho-CoA synthase
MSDTTCDPIAAEIDALAVAALTRELACYPKPGLVSFVDAGSHDDMTAETFMRSIAALDGYFGEMADAGARGAGFADLNRMGRRAEARMFASTGGVNTHRGAVFALGLLAAAAGWVVAGGGAKAADVCSTVALRWGEAILEAAWFPQDASHGAAVRARYGAPGAREEAAAGFPTVLGHALPAFRAARAAGLEINAASVQALFAIVAVLPDNNLLYRGGAAALADAQGRAGAFLSTGGMLAPGGFARAVCVHEAFVAKRHSPGGAADLLAATLFLVGLEDHGFRT